MKEENWGCDYDSNQWRTVLNAAIKLPFSNQGGEITLRFSYYLLLKKLNEMFYIKDRNIAVGVATCFELECP